MTAPDQQSGGSPRPAQTRWEAWQQSVGDRPKIAAAVLFGLVALGLLWGPVVRLVGAQGTLRAPAPSATADEEFVPSLPPSLLNVPVRYRLGDVVQALERAIPRTYGTLDDRHEVESNDRLEVAYELERSAFDTRLVDDVAHVAATVSYRARVWVDAPLLPDFETSCGMDEDRPRPRLRVEMSARLSLSSDWRLLAEPEVDRVVPASDEERDRCSITAFGIDVTDRVVDGAFGALVDQLPRIERELEAIDLRSRFVEWWATLYEPIELDDEVWLAIGPQSVRRGPTRGSGDELVATVGLTAQPRFVLGPRPPLEPRPLPALDSAGVGEGLRILASGRADYDAITRELNDQLTGAVLERDGNTLRIRSLELSGIGGGRLALELNFDGTAKGRAYLVGTPNFDPAAGQVHVPDLEFDVATSNLLVDGFAWLADPAVTRFLRERARWPTSNVAELAAEQLGRGLNHEITEGARLRGSVDSVRIVSVYARTDALIVHAQAEASAELLVR